MLTWSKLARSTRRTAKRLAGRRMVHPDPGVTEVLYARRRSGGDWGLTIAFAGLAFSFLVSTVGQLPTVGFLALGIQVAMLLWTLVHAEALRSVVIALAYDQTARRVLPFVVAGDRGFRPHELTVIVAAGGVSVVLILANEGPPQPIRLAMKVLLGLVIAGLLALVLVRPRRGKPLATIEPDGIHFAHLDLWAPWSAFSGIDIDGVRLRWQLRDPKDFRRLTRLRGLRRFYWRLRIASGGGALVLPLSWMRDPAEALHRVPWGLAAPPAIVDHGETVAPTRRS